MRDVILFVVLVGIFAFLVSNYDEDDPSSLFYPISTYGEPQYVEVNNKDAEAKF
jgi:C1A family cysteine protease